MRNDCESWRHHWKQVGTLTACALICYQTGSGEVDASAAQLTKISLNEDKSRSLDPLLVFLPQHKPEQAAPDPPPPHWTIFHQNSELDPEKVKSGD